MTQYPKQVVVLHDKDDGFYVSLPDELDWLDDKDGQTVGIYELKMTKKVRVGGITLE